MDQLIQPKEWDATQIPSQLLFLFEQNCDGWICRKSNFINGSFAGMA